MVSGQRHDSGRQTVNLNESGGVTLAVASAGGERCDVFAVQRVRRPDSGIDDVAFVKFQANLSGYRLLRFGDECGERPAKRGTVRWAGAEFFRTFAFDGLLLLR